MFLTSKMSIFCEKHRLHFFSMWKCKENLIVAAQWAAGKRQILVEHIIKLVLSQTSFHPLKLRMILWCCAPVPAAHGGYIIYTLFIHHLSTLYLSIVYK